MNPFPSKEDKLIVTNSLLTPRTLQTTTMILTVLLASALLFAVTCWLIPTILLSLHEVVVVFSIIIIMVVVFYLTSLGGGHPWSLKPLPASIAKEGFYKEEVEVTDLIKEYSDLYKAQKMRPGRDSVPSEQ